MIIRRQTPTDTRSINKWLKAHRIDLISEQSYESFIIPGVCAGQFLLCELNTVIFDSLISNPHVSLGTRNKALNELVAYMLQKAKGKRVIAFTTNSSTISRAKSFGFTQLEHAVLAYKG